MLKIMVLGLGLTPFWYWPALAQTSLEGRSPLSHPLVTARSTPPPRWIPEPAEFQPAVPSFNSQRLNQQIQLYTQYLAAYGPPDVLIVGSSRSLQGIDPVALQTTLAAQGYDSVRVYNFGVNGATAQVVDLIVRRLLTPEQLPKLILWGDGLRAFNSGRPDQTYTSILASVGYQGLSAGQHPILFPLPALNRSSRSPIEPECWDSLHWWQAGDNPSLADVEAHFFPCPWGRSRSDSSTDPLQFTPPTLRRFVPELEVNGFQAVVTEFDPSRYYQQYPLVPGNYDASYVPFQLEGEQKQATEALARYLRSQRIPLIFVNLPLSQEYLDPVRQEYERLFYDFIQQLAAREGFLVRNLLGTWADQSSYFADPSHLNQQGARAVAQRLGEDTGIPWNRFLP